MYRGSVHIAINVFAFGLFCKHHGHIKVAGRHAGNCNARCLNRQDLVYSVILKNAVKLLADFIQQVNIQLVVQKAVNFQHIARADLPIAQNAVFQKLHLKYPFHIYQLLCLIPPRFSTLKTRFFIFLLQTLSIW